MKKQSSIEWLESQVVSKDWLSEKGKAIFEQAKEMHKQEINDAYNEGVYLSMTPSKTSEDYYKNTYENDCV